MSRKLLVGVVTLVLASGYAVAQEKKKAAGPLGLPDSATLKEKVGFTDDQVKKTDELYASYKDKVKEAQAKAKEDKANAKAVQDLRTEIVGKLEAIATSDDQKTKLKDLTTRKKKADK